MYQLLKYIESYLKFFSCFSYFKKNIYKNIKYHFITWLFYLNWIWSSIEPSDYKFSYNDFTIALWFKYEQTERTANNKNSTLGLKISIKNPIVVISIVSANEAQILNVAVCSVLAYWSN